MIIYFTGTGNSKYIANIFENQLEDCAVNAANLIKSGSNPCFSSEKPYIFISPVYAWRMPRIFENWIQKCKFQGNKQAYFVLTCGDSIGAADNYVKKFAEKTDFEYMGTAEVMMPENYIVMFSSPNEEQSKAIISGAAEYTVSLSRQILSKKPFERRHNTLGGHLCSDIVTPFFYKFYIGAKKFYSTDFCISCGKCADNCMLNNIQLMYGKPIWGKNCTHCMACISKCPTGAIEYGKHTIGLRRYTCPKQ